MSVDLARLRFHRQRAGLSQERLAAQLGVSLKTVARWESGETKAGLHARLDEVAAHLGVDPRDLLAGAGQESDLERIERKLDRLLSHLGLAA